MAERLVKDLSYLRLVLSARQNEDGDRWRGFAFIFLDPGWAQLLQGMRGNPLDMAVLGGDLTMARMAIEGKLRKSPTLTALGPPQERIVTAGHLIDLLRLLAAAARGRQQDLDRLLTGEAGTLRYDAPKIIEAAIRIANIGRQVPVFRFDDDVIFFGERDPEIRRDEKRRKDAADATAANVLRLCDRYRELSMDPQVHYFVYSGGYKAPPQVAESQGAIDPRILEGSENESLLVNGFATRVLQLVDLPAQRRRGTEEGDKGSLRPSVVVKFLKELYKLGANPFRQVISGAGLCLSDSAILDLPPFSNMHLNVMWIDDHLKYALHDELGHFGRWTRSHYVARVPETCFPQRRHPKDDKGPLFTYKDVRWHLKKYMLRLILGCVADAWLRKKPELKLSTRELDDSDYKGLMDAVPGLCGSQFMGVVPGGWGDLPEAAKPEFRERLWKRARERLGELVEAWSAPEYKDTFLGLFVFGRGHRRYQGLKDRFPTGMPEGLRKAVDGLPADCPQPQAALSGGVPEEAHLEKALRMLVDDFVEYFSLVQFWPFFVQSVRCLLNRYAQSFQTDLEWMLPAFEPEDPSPPRNERAARGKGVARKTGARKTRRKRGHY